MLKGKKVGVVIPCFKIGPRVIDLIQRVPDFVDQIYLIDDGCPLKTGLFVKDNNSDNRVTIKTHEVNRGVGAAIVTGYKAALKDCIDIIVKVDGDGQMPPERIKTLISLVLEGKADYTKGNRFYFPAHLKGMPKVRIFGNSVLSFISKFSSGYWNIFDPNNGFTAIDSRVLKLLELDKLSPRYFFESDVLFRLNAVKAVVSDVPMPSVYGEEKSGLKELRIIPEFLFKHCRNFSKRIVYSYFLRECSVASLELVSGLILVFSGLIIGIDGWLFAYHSASNASAGQVILPSLLFLVGFQFLLSFLNFDISNVPQTPIADLLEETEVR